MYWLLAFETNNNQYTGTVSIPGLALGCPQFGIITRSPAGRTQQLHLAIPHREGSFTIALIDTTNGGSTVLDVKQVTTSATADTLTFDFKPLSRKVLVLGTSVLGGTSVIAMSGYYTHTVTLVPTSVVSTVCSDGEYRYDFNTQMKTNEWAGVGNHYTALYWEYDSRTGRRANIDPKFEKFPGISPYVTNGDNPIQNFDRKGDELGLAILGAVVGAGISIGKSISEKGLKGAFVNGEWKKTIAHAGVAATQGAIIGLTNGGSLLANAALSAEASFIDDAIDGKIQSRADLKVAALKAVTKGALSYGLGALFSRFDGAIEAVGEVSKPLMRILQSKAMIINGLIDWGTDNILDRTYGGWDEGSMYSDPESSDGRGYRHKHHRGLFK